MELAPAPAEPRGSSGLIARTRARARVVWATTRRLSSLKSYAETEPTKKEVGYNPRCTLLEAGPQWGTLVPVMSRSPDRRSTLERGSPETEPRSCGTQPAHESLFNRRLRVLSPAVRTNDRRSPQRRRKKLRPTP